MLLLFETAAGFALFKVLKEGKVEEAEVSFGGRQRLLPGGRAAPLGSGPLGGVAP